MKLSNYYYHGLQNPQVFSSILEKGILSRNYLRKIEQDHFSSAKDFLDKEGTNGLDKICVCEYKSMSYYLFAYPNITLIIKKDPLYKIESGSLEGEYLIEDYIPAENIMGIGIRLVKNNTKEIAEYIKTVKEIKKKTSLPFYNLENGKRIEEQDFSDMYKKLEKSPRRNILLIGPSFSGIKEITKELEKNNFIQIYSSEIQKMNNTDSFEKKSKKFMKRYKEEKEAGKKTLYNDSIIDYKKYFTKEEWNRLLEELKITEKELKKNYDVVIHVYSFVYNYRNLFDKKIPNPIKTLLKMDEQIEKIWKKENHYYEVLPKESINEKLEEVKKIINQY